jgi:lipoprotein-releasing system permease protein
VQDLIGADPNQLSGIAVRVVNDDDVEEIKASLMFLKEKYPDNLRIQTWMEKDKNLLQAVRLEKWLITAIIFMVLCLVTALIVALLTMSVVEKRRDIGILRSLGASGGGIMSIFLSQGLMIVIVGALIGLIWGLLFVGNINFLADEMEDLTGYHPFPKKIYYLDEIPTRIQFAEILTLVIALVLVSFTLSLFPAGRAVRINPIQALRYE